MNKKYKQFKIKDIFEIKSSNGIFHAVNVNISNIPLKNMYPYIVRTSQNNGIRGYIEQDEKKLNEGNTISFAQDTAECFYQNRPYFTGNKIKIFKLKGKEISESIALYLLRKLKDAFKKYGWGSSFDTKLLENEVIQLPINNVGDIDYEYMEERIKELEEERIKELEKYLEVSGLENYELTKEDEEVLKRKVEFKEFKLSDIFDIKTTKSANKNNIEFDKNGEYDFIGRSSVNYGIQGKVNKMAYEPNDKDTFSLVQVGESCLLYREKEWYASQNIFILKSNDVNINKNHLYIQGAISKKLEPYKEAYTYPTLADVKEIEIHLPVDKQGQIDYEYMNDYIQAIKKKTIAGVVKYKDQVIEITKKVVAKTNKR